MSKKTNIKDLKFEDALDRLETIISRLQEDQLSLDESLETFQEGIGLVKVCQKKLDDMETRVNILIKNEDGTLDEVPFESESEK